MSDISDVENARNARIRAFRNVQKKAGRAFRRAFWATYPNMVPWETT